MLTYVIAAAASSNASHPLSFKNTHLPFLSVPDLVLSQRIGVQVADLHSRKVLAEVSVRHPELAVIVKCQTNFILLFLGNESPLLRPNKDPPSQTMLANFFLKNVLVGPGAVPFGLVTPGISQSDEGDFSRHGGCVDVHILHPGDTVSVSLDQTLGRTRLQHVRIGLNIFFSIIPTQIKL